MINNNDIIVDLCIDKKQFESIEEVESLIQQSIRTRESVSKYLSPDDSNLIAVP